MLERFLKHSMAIYSAKTWRQFVIAALSEFNQVQEALTPQEQDQLIETGCASFTERDMGPMAFELN